jgi:hypothetical protein
MNRQRNIFIKLPLLISTIAAAVQTGCAITTIREAEKMILGKAGIKARSRLTIGSTNTY